MTVLNRVNEAGKKGDVRSYHRGQGMDSSIACIDSTFGSRHVILGIGQ